MTFEQITTGFEGIYEVSEAARLLLVTMHDPEYSDSAIHYRVRNRHLIRWIHQGLAHPGLAGVTGRQLLLTFEDLISMRVIAFLRALNYSFAKIRHAEYQLRDVTGHLRPFATDDIWAEKEGSKDIFGEMAAALLVATRHGQLAFRQLFQERLISVHGLTFDERGIAARWRPRSGILLDPKVQFGRPCISGTRIPTGEIAGMVGAGDSRAFLAKSYPIPQEQIEEAVAWEMDLASA